MPSVWLGLACGMTLFVTMACIFWVRPDASDDAPHRSKLDELLDRRDAVYENMRDLRFEYHAGKFSEKDFEEMKHSLETEAAGLLAEMDRATGGAPTAATRQTAETTVRGSVG